MPGNTNQNHNDTGLTVLKFTDSNKTIDVKHTYKQIELDELYILGLTDKILVYTLEKNSTVQLATTFPSSTNLSDIIKKYKIEPNKIFISGNLL